MLTGKNIYLRPLKLEDLTLINSWRNDLDNKILTIGYRLPVSIEKDEEWLKKKLLNYSDTEVFFALVEKETSDFIGIILLNNINYISGTSEWGFIIGDKNKRGKGYSVEALTILFAYAFNVLNLRKLFAYCLKFNTGILKTQERIGKYHSEGCLKKHVYFKGEYHDVTIQSFFREDNDFKDVFDTLINKPLK